MLERIVEILQSQSLAVGYAFVFGVLLLCGFGFPMPEDVILVTGGVLAWLASPLEHATLGAMLRDRGFVTMALVGLGGILAGDSEESVQAEGKGLIRTSAHENLLCL